MTKNPFYRPGLFLSQFSEPKPRYRVRRILSQNQTVILLTIVPVFLWKNIIPANRYKIIDGCLCSVKQVN